MVKYKDMKHERKMSKKIKVYITWLTDLPEADFGRSRALFINRMKN